MAKIRSPNYPSMSLGPALEAVRPAYEKEHRNKMARSVLAKHMGYSSLNGRALGKIGAVRAYGLIEGSGEELRISDDTVKALMAPAGSSERTEALGRLANRPQLFQELTKEFPNTLPSLDNLKYALIKRNFIPDAAEKAAKSYLATMNLVGGIQDEYNPPDDEEENSDMNEAQLAADAKRLLDTPVHLIKKPVQEVFNLPEGTVTITFPQRLSVESYQDMEDQLELLLRRVKRQIAKDDEAAN
ncbi:hypothetical protein [Bradyrhizobium commune]|uniref:Uncharacterized protein n=1 Tax=Bradyrhizobium commune TaxID=83627 RepID=A0A7S9DAF1_9BRAD|nr:hypothetical protein [Bradyrhizobium commune]QPF94100.1 hypothetical protein IC761_12835 [Bradyrhizobium commune]